MSKKPTYEDLEHRIQELEQSVSENKRACEALRKSEEMFRLAFENANEGVCFVDKNGSLVRVNKRMCDIFGYSQKELESMTVNDIAHPEDRDISPKFIEKSISGEVQGTVFEKRYFHKQGHLILCQVSSSIVRNEKGDFLNFISHVQDITQSKQAEEALRESEERYRSLVESTEDFVCTIDRNGRYLYANKKYLNKHGLKKDDFIGRNHTDFHTVAAAQLFKARLNTVFETGKSVTYENKDELDNRYYIRMLSPIIGPDGKTAAVTSIAKDITERVLTENALRESEEKYKILAESSQTGIYIHQDDTIVYANGRFAELHGYTVDELIGMKYSNLFHPDDRERALQIKEKRLRGDEDTPQYYEAKRVKKDGGVMWGQTVAGLIEFQGKPAIIGNVVDITKRKQAENELLTQKYFLQKAQEIGKIGTWDLDIKNNKLLWTDEIYKIFELPIGTELTYETFLDCIHPDDREYVENEWKASFAGKPYDIEHRLFVNGKVKWVREKAELTFDEKGECVRGTGFAQDITDRKQAEEAFKESEAKYRYMMESMDDMSYICSKDFRVEYMNTAMIKRTGRDATGELCHKAIHGLDGKCPWCIHEKVMQGEALKTEVISPLDNRVFHVSNTPIYHKPGSISKMTVFRDITETKKIEERLQQAQKMESIGTLAGGIAHDFNNILFPLMGFAERLKDDLPADSPLQENVNGILRAALRSKDLVKQILAFSRQSTHEVKPVRVQQILKEVLKLCRSTIPPNIEIVQDIQSDCGLVMADPIQIHQIAMNLVTNSYHAVEPTGGEISVELKEIEIDSGDTGCSSLEPGCYAVLAVSDTGCGIDPAVMDKIFEPYFTTKDQSKGTGLGLSIVYGIVKDHHGDITAYSELGKGTTFKVYLPLMEKASKTVGQN